MSKSAFLPRRGRSCRTRRNGSQSSSSDKSIKETSVPGPSAPSKVSRPQQRDAGGRLVAQSNPAGQSTSGPAKSTDTTLKTSGATFKQGNIISRSQGEVIHFSSPPDLEIPFLFRHWKEHPFVCHRQDRPALAPYPPGRAAKIAFSVLLTL